MCSISIMVFTNAILAICIILQIHDTKECNDQMDVYYCIGINRGGILDEIGINIFQIASAIKFAGYYYLGAYLYTRNSNNKWLSLITFAGSIVFFLGDKLLETYSLSISVKILRLILQFSCSYCGIIFIYHIICRLTMRINGIFKSKLWTCLKDKSFGIYLFHQQIIYLTIPFLNGKVSPIIQMILSFICAVSVSSLITTLLKRFKITRKLYGLQLCLVC